MEPSADRLEKFLSKRSFEEIYLMLFSHGVNSIGLASHERWEKILEKATLRGEFVGVDDTAYPADFASIARYRDALVQTIPSRYPIPPPLEAQDMEQFLTRNRRRYKVSIEEGFPWKVTTTANRGTGKKPKAKGNQGTV